MKGSSDELEEIAVAAGVLNKRAVRALWKDFRRGRLHWSRAWALTVLGATVHDQPSRQASQLIPIPGVSASMRLA